MSQALRPPMEPGEGAGWRFRNCQVLGRLSSTAQVLPPGAGPVEPEAKRELAGGQTEALSEEGGPCPAVQESGPC